MFQRMQSSAWKWLKSKCSCNPNSWDHQMEFACLLRFPRKKTKNLSKLPIACLLRFPRKKTKNLSKFPIECQHCDLSCLVFGVGVGSQTSDEMGANGVFPDLPHKNVNWWALLPVAVHLSFSQLWWKPWTGANCRRSKKVVQCAWHTGQTSVFANRRGGGWQINNAFLWENIAVVGQKKLCDLLARFFELVHFAFGKSAKRWDHSSLNFPFYSAS